MEFGKMRVSRRSPWHWGNKSMLNEPLLLSFQEIKSSSFWQGSLAGTSHTDNLLVSGGSPWHWENYAEWANLRLFSFSRD